MTVVSTKEFNTNQKRYFDLAKNEQIVIRRGENIFHLTCAPVETYPEQEILRPDDDLRSGITKEEFKKRAHQIVHNFFANK